MSNSIDAPGGAGGMEQFEADLASDTGEQVGLAALEGVDADQWSALYWLSRALHVDNADVSATLEAILVRATDVIPGAEAAGINLYVRGKFEPQAVHGAAPPVLDDLQARTGVGPCIDASREQRTIEVVDMRETPYWPNYGELAVSLGVFSMLCLPLYVDQHRLGSLSLYGKSVDAFHGHPTHLAELFAAHAALALSEAQRSEHLRRALENRDLIGQAKGVLMARLAITADRAFQLLSESSQRSNRKLVDIAEAVTMTGELPPS